jgi:hypothetical protein
MHGQRTSFVKTGERQKCPPLIPNSDCDTVIGILQVSNISTQYSWHLHSGCVYKRFNLTSSSWPETSDSTNRSMKSRTWADSSSIAVPLSWAETRRNLSLIQAPDMSYTSCEMPIFLNFQKIKKTFYHFSLCNNDLTCTQTKSLNFEHTPPNTKFNKIPL